MIIFINDDKLSQRKIIYGQINDNLLCKSNFQCEKSVPVVTIVIYNPIKLG
jgi:hypothetical protein